MKKRGLKAGITFAMAMLFLAVQGVWAVFFVYTFRRLAAETERSAQRMGQQVIAVMEEEFLPLESAAFELSQSAVARDFVTTASALDFHEKAAGVSEYINGVLGRSHFVDSLVLYGSEERYYRFAGSISNTSAAKAYYAGLPGNAPTHLVVQLEGTQYVGYATGIYSGKTLAGKVVVLIEEHRVRALFNQYTAQGDLDLALVVDGEVVIASNDALNGMSLDELAGQYSATDSRRVGYTPFEIVVGWRSGYLSASAWAFALVAAALAAIFGVLMLVYTRYMQRHFFRPMLEVMHGVERLGDGMTVLPSYGEAEFDRLAGTINDMVRRLDERSYALYETQYRLQAAEIERQQALVAALKKQISAHFTVNALSSIKLLSERGETEKASVMCAGLSRLIRYANAGDEFINGLDEFETLEHYIAIMQVRYPGRFTVEMDLSDALDDIEMPRVLVQPLVENAILHGFRNTGQGGRVLITGQVERQRVVVTVEDNGAGIPKAELAALRARIDACARGGHDLAGLENIALCNVAVRLMSYYGAGAGLDIACPAAGGTRVVMTFPRWAEPGGRG